jgi:hypothetical protein
MFRKKKDRWLSFIQNPPRPGDEILCSDYYKIWIGKVVQNEMAPTWTTKDSKNVLLTLVKNNYDQWIVDTHYSFPLCWRYLPSLPERPYVTYP